MNTPMSNTRPGGWPAIFAATAVCLTTLTGAAGLAYRQPICARAAERQTVPSVAVWAPGEPRPFTEADRPLMDCWHRIMSPTAASSGDDWGLAQTASYCLMKEQMLRCQQMPPGQTLAQQPCRTVLIACDPLYTPAERRLRLDLFEQSMSGDAVPQAVIAAAAP